MEKIGIIAPYPEFITLARTAAATMNQPVVVRIGILDKAIHTAEKMIAEDQVEAIIARYPSGQLVKENVDIPVILIPITNFDLVRSFHKARQLGINVVFLDFVRPEIKTFYQIEVVNEVMGLAIERISFTEIEETSHAVDQALERGADVIVATASCMIEQARNRGIPGVLVYTDPQDIMQAIEQARVTIQARKREIEKAKVVTTVIENVYDGIIGISSQGKVQVCNKIALDTLNFTGASIVGESIHDLAQQHAIVQKIYANGAAIEGEIIEHLNDKYVVNRIPLTIDEESKGMLIWLQKTSHVQQMESIIRKKLYVKGLVAKMTFDEIIGNSAEMGQLKQKAYKYARSDATVMIYGESGTGKELFAQSMHNVSLRSKGPFLAVNCAALPNNILESELFGYEEGAFTGARKGGKVGLFELAHSGTLFLDEIGEMELSTQSKLLRVIQEKEVFRLGGDSVIHVDVRIICATNQDLATKIATGTFRHDLYYRINILDLRIPPLRERRTDIPAIAKTIIRKISDKSKIRLECSEKLLLDLAQCKYAWPGNVRELESFWERLLALTEGGRVTESLFGEILSGLKAVNVPPVLSATHEDKMELRLGTMEEMEHQIFETVHNLFQGDREKVADLLKVSKTTLWRKLNKTQP